MNATEEKIVADARKLGVLDETKLRDLKIYREYLLLKQHPDYKYETAISSLANKYFLSVERIRTIIWEQNKISTSSS